MTPTKRHQPHTHHWSITWIGLGVAATLVVILALTYGQTASAPHFEPPKGSMGHEVDAASGGVDQDMGQLDQVDISGADLNESTLMN